jgi:hypothetical protein
LSSIGARRRDLFDDGLVKRGHAGVAGLVIEVALPFLWRSRAWRGVDGREIELLVGGVEFEEKLETSCRAPCAGGVVAIDLVDDHDGLGADFEGLAQHEARLRLRAVVASTTSNTPSIIFRMRSTSPPKSAWPGVSTMLMW